MALHCACGSLRAATSAPPPSRRTALRMRRRGCPRCWTPTTRGRQSARTPHRACAKRPYRGVTAGNPRPASPLALRMCEQRRLAAAPHHTTRGAGAQHRDPQSPGTGPGRAPQAALPPSAETPRAGAGLHGLPCLPPETPGLGPGLTGPGQGPAALHSTLGIFFFFSGDCFSPPFPLSSCIIFSSSSKTFSACKFRVALCSTVFSRSKENAGQQRYCIGTTLLQLLPICY